MARAASATSSIWAFMPIARQHLINSARCPNRRWSAASAWSNCASWKAESPSMWLRRLSTPWALIPKKIFGGWKRSFQPRSIQPRRRGGAENDLLSHESFCIMQDFLHQLRRGGLGINSQQRLSAGGTQQHPSIGSAACGRRIQIKLHAIEVGGTHNGVPAQLRHPVAGAANRILLDFFGDVQIQPAVMMLAELALQIGHQLRQRLAFLRHD